MFGSKAHYFNFLKILSEKNILRWSNIIVLMCQCRMGNNESEF